jgi:hypothetical protein
VWLSACAAPPAFTPAPVAIAVDHARAPGPRLAPGQAVDNVPLPAPTRVCVDVFALRSTPAAGSIEPQLLAIIAERDPLFRGASSLPPGTRWAHPAVDTDAGARVGSAVGAVAAGLVTTFRPAPLRLPAIRCEPTPDGMRLVLLCRATPARGVERALLREPLATDDAAMLFVPADEAGFAGHAVVITVAGTPSAGELAAAEAAAAAAAQRAPVPPMAAAQWRLAADAIGAQPRRTAMLAVAAQLGLPHCSDLLLAADEPRLVAIGTEVARLDAASPDYAWQFERAMWTALVPGLLRDELPPGLRAAATRRLGAVVFEPTALQDILESSADAAAFAAAVHEENYRALSDRNPLHRIRGHDWLTARHQVVVGYDPLATAAARAAALRAHDDAGAAR